MAPPHVSVRHSSLTFAVTFHKTSRLPITNKSPPDAVVNSRARLAREVVTVAGKSAGIVINMLDSVRYGRFLSLSNIHTRELAMMREEISARVPAAVAVTVTLDKGGMVTLAVLVIVRTFAAATENRLPLSKS